MAPKMEVSMLTGIKTFAKALLYGLMVGNLTARLGRRRWRMKQASGIKPIAANHIHDERMLR
ncbi:MAG: hypothetical protein V4647_05495 [Pseudomonadota bacterium]